jgi:Lactonase, 7-bladed beta-propeller
MLRNSFAGLLFSRGTHLDNFLYVLHETSSTLSVQAIPQAPSDPTTPVLAEVSIIPSDSPLGSTFAAAEILIPDTTTEFSTPYIYVSNRNTGTPDPRGDTIAIFQHVQATSTSPDTLVLVAQVFTGLDQIRGMEIGSVEAGSVEFLVASGFAGTGGVVVFRRVNGGAGLVEVARNTEVLTRTSFVWL